IQTPPIDCFSTSATRLPAFTALMAARCPPGPEPTTISSYGCIYIFLCVRFVRWGSRAGLHVRSSIDDLRSGQRTRARRINSAGSQLHEMLLHRKPVSIPHRARPGVCAIGVQNASFACVGEVRRQNLVADTLAEMRLLERKHRFNAFVEIARHPIGAAEIQLGLAAVLEVIDAAVFQESPDDTPHSNSAA